jgi:hypothetical protein
MRRAFFGRRQFSFNPLIEVFAPDVGLDAAPTVAAANRLRRAMVRFGYYPETL